MERKEKIENLIQIREDAITLEKQVLNDMLQKCHKKISEDTAALVLDIYNDLKSQARDPYQSSLMRDIKFDSKANYNLFMNYRKEVEPEWDSLSDTAKLLTRCRTSLLWDMINTEKLFSVLCKDESYLINIDEFEKLLDEYGLSYVPFKSDDYVSYGIRVELNNHVLTRDKSI